MISKTFGLWIVSIFVLVMIMSFGSAAITLTPTISPAILTKTQNFTSFNISSGNDLVNFTFPKTTTIKDSEGHQVGLEITNTSDLNNVTSATFDVIATSIDPNFNFGKHFTTLTIKAENVTDSSDNTSINVLIYFEVPFCEDCENPGDLNIYIDDVSIVEGFGDDDDYWYPFDEIEIDLIIEPGEDYDIEDIEVEWALYTESGDKIADDKESDFNLDEDDDDKELTIKFKLDNKISKLEGEEKLIFYVKAEGKIDDKDSSHDNERTCEWDLTEVELITDDDFVVLDDIKINGLELEDMELKETVSCGTELQITADIWNIGDDRQDDVYIRIYSEELGIDKTVTFDDIKSFDNEKLDAVIEIPKDVEEGWYSIEFTIYDEDNDVFETEEEEDEAEFIILLKVEGNCVAESKVMVSAELESGGKAGKEMVVKATITNTGNGLANYNLNVVGHTEWASLVNIEPDTVLLSAGDSKDVLITFDVNKDVSGDKLFNIEVLSGDELVKEQAVSVFIEESGFSFPGITGGVISKDNAYLWGIGILNVILVLVIIFVAIRVARK